MSEKVSAKGRNAPGPRGREAIFTNLSRLKKDPYDLFLTSQRRFGDIVRLRLGPYITHQVTHPEYVKHVLQDNNRNYRRGKMYENFKLFFGNGILTSDGEAWRKHRQIVQPLFHRTIIDGMAATMVEVAEKTVRRWEGVERAGKPMDIVPEMMELSLEVLGRTMFSTSLSETAHDIGPAVRTSIRAMIFTGAWQEMTPKWIPIPYNVRLARAQKTLGRIMKSIIQDHRDSKEDRFDLVSLLLASRDESGQGLAEQQIHDELMTIFMAGHETSGTALSWILYNVGKHPHVRHKLESELESVLGGRSPGLEDIGRLTYTKMVVEESLRMYPPIWLFPRDANQEDEIGGYRIPKDSPVFLMPFVTHRHPEFWENPDAFDPERFLPEHAAKRPRFAYFPFGGGQRQCIGNHMAMTQMIITLAIIAQRFHLHPVPGHSLRCGTLVSLRPLQGIPMTIRSSKAGFRPGGRIPLGEAKHAESAVPAA